MPLVRSILLATEKADHGFYRHKQQQMPISGWSEKMSKTLAASQVANESSREYEMDVLVRAKE